jgi:chromosomal replication initiator protein
VEADVPRPIPDASHDLVATWRRAQEELRASVSESTYQLWFDQLRPVSSRGPTIFLTGPRHVLRWVGKRYPELLRAAIRKGGSGLREFELVASDDAQARSAPRSSAEAAARVTLNPAYTFERFVIGPGSQFAHAAALAVAEAPGEAYNPLFLHGPPGLGKTHLLGAIANYLHHHSPELTVHYTTAETFTNEFVSSLQGTGIADFKQRYRRADVLLIDDVQFLQGKARTADEFFHTFNALYEAGAQIVLTADRLPAELSALADRLRDRFEWGLTVAVEPPDLPTRLVFLGNLARERSEQVAPEALRAIAARAASNLRLLEGALTRMLALGSLTSSAITPEAVDRALPGPGASPTSAKPEVAQVQRAVADRLDVPVERILSPSRVAPIARARQLAMYLTRELTELSLPEIAAAFNRRDHTTVMHAIRKVEARALEDAALTRTIEELSADLAAPGIGRDRTD